ncbi:MULTISPECIES: LLM class flavin-dependent oxidoreductase [Streptomyces]|uniref:Alkanesulfonate monooxygenase SsuD/methylene tetrahydromethanopterin reductase-like flavin-dependent oxidoreductase (Luciferase family) n=1 Tax=Streptomyces nymphaeiformis TaxID=2663842 RepID=A0A7W7TYS5_9ACTN|nr:hypothetical protein [Streptomyces nymphaeiformis]MBB4980415.1 alkanesulfonate monooxygenase SsuD/methylene tetrahydromethanopterin reductase-like flavin-dependent oxidoreductase (luciferase family) [Streptomyces nymphaeiformis]
MTENGLTTWVGVDGTPQSVVRTAKYGFPLMIAITGGSPTRFAPYVDLYGRAAEQFGTTAHPVGMHSPGFVADTDEQARELRWPRYKVMRDRIGAPETVARKMAAAIKGLGVGRFDMIYGSGAMPVSARLRAVELYGTKAVPMVRDILAG